MYLHYWGIKAKRTAERKNKKDGEKKGRGRETPARHRRDIPANKKARRRVLHIRCPGKKKSPGGEGFFLCRSQCERGSDVKELPGIRRGFSLSRSGLHSRCDQNNKESKERRTKLNLQMGLYADENKRAPASIGWRNSVRFASVCIILFFGAESKFRKIMI